MAFNLYEWWHRKRVRTVVQHSGRPVRAHSIVNPYHAVSVKAGLSCPETAATVGGQRFLSREAPQLPLPTCDAQRCSCRYRHHDDRRTGVDRRHRDVWDRRAVLTGGGERRRGVGRRSTDH